jgi:hypothetical protein
MAAEVQAAAKRLKQAVVQRLADARYAQQHTGAWVPLCGRPVAQ